MISIKKNMKYIVTLFLLVALANTGIGQSAPKPSDPCQKLDTNTIKKLIIGTWVEVKDTSHIIVITTDSVEETIIVNLNGKPSANQSFWNYKFTDNIFSTDDITCYSLREYKEGYNHNVDIAINFIDAKYLLMGSSGKTVFKRRN